MVEIRNENIFDIVSSQLGTLPNPIDGFVIGTPDFFLFLEWGYVALSSSL